MLNKPQIEMPKTTSQKNTPITFEVEEKLLSRLRHVQEQTKAGSLSETIRQALNAYKFETFTNVVSANRQISIRLPQPMKDELTKVSTEKKVSIGELLRVAIHDLCSQSPNNQKTKAMIMAITTPKRKTARKPVAKKVTVKKVVKKTAAKKPVAKKPAAKKAVAKKSVAKKAVAKKPVAKKKTAAKKRPAAKKSATKKAVAKKTTAKKVAKKPAARKSAAKKKPAAKKKTGTIAKLIRTAAAQF